jgi:hypothetical protein
MNSALPEAPDTVGVQRTVGADQSEVFLYGLSHHQPIEWITVMKWQS